ncbi:MAG: hypothetical protein EZS26_000785 [Candidatus Ordinivivax streblomastigis]|uniref:Uncharacterized protein n=1 Tax=Candidatus Ordinivivax streblomastigis TaxID=2540710 RepID=A0A5M8P4C5_9BACT|nr:MAG: hypothetical protein EZS26_000785 [Candidatus Ordinivivax streblomastigis]
MNADLSKYKEGFNAGFLRLRQIDVERATNDLWEALGVNNRESFRYYKLGRQKCDAEQIEKVENVFRNYGVTDKIWGV